MESKKNPNVDLTKKRGLYLSIGFAISFLLVITAFDWKFYDDGNWVDLGQVRDDFEEMLEIPPTEQPPPPPPPKIQQPEIIEVPDEEEIEEEIEIDLDVEIVEETVIEEIIIEEAPEEEEVEEIYTFVETMPEPEMGFKAFYSYIAKNIKYPRKAEIMGIEGKVFIQFRIDKEGNIFNPKVVKGVGVGIDEEAMRVFKNGPKWKPGKQRGKPVMVKMTIQLTFKLA